MLSTADSGEQSEEQEFVDWILFHATVCKHENVVKMLFCQTDTQPISLILEACSPGDLLSFLWTLRNVMLAWGLLFKSTRDAVNNQARGEGAEICPSLRLCTDLLRPRLELHQQGGTRMRLLGQKIPTFSYISRLSFIQGDSEDSLVHFSERSVFLVAKQVAAGLVS